MLFFICAAPPFQKFWIRHSSFTCDCLFQLLVEQAKELIERGVNIDGVGIQGHFTGPVNPFLLRVSDSTE